MSKENVELMQRFHAAFNARDLDALFAILDPDFHWFPLMARLEGEELRGREGVRRWIERLDEDWDDFRTDPQEFHDLGDAVLSLGTWQARARASGVEVEGQKAAWLARMRDGKVISQETFTDQAEARRSAGLES